MVTCAKAIKEVFKNNDQVLNTKQIIAVVQKKYPEKRDRGMRNLHDAKYYMG